MFGNFFCLNNEFVSSNVDKINIKDKKPSFVLII